MARKSRYRKRGRGGRFVRNPGKKGKRGKSKSHKRKRRMSTKAHRKIARKYAAAHGLRFTMTTAAKKRKSAKKAKAAAAKARRAEKAAKKRAMKKERSRKRAVRRAEAAQKAAARLQARAGMYTVKMNPRKRRKSRKHSRRRSHRRRSYAAAPRRRRRRNPRHVRRNRSHRRRNSFRRYRRNPGLKGFPAMIMGLLKKAAPVIGGMVVGKLVSKQVMARVPGVSRLGQFQGVAVSVGMLALGHVATTKVKALSKYHDQVMLGLAINTVMEGLSMIPQVKGFLGLGEGIYDRALSDYVTTSDYLTTGATPIDDDIALADYVTTGALEEELGLSEELGISEELGLSEELGAIEAGTVRGGVSQMAMIKSIPHQGFSEEIPARSFSKGVSHAGAGYDNPGALYAGIFRGGF